LVQDSRILKNDEQNDGRGKKSDEESRANAAVAILHRIDLKVKEIVLRCHALILLQKEQMARGTDGRQVLEGKLKFVMVTIEGKRDLMWDVTARKLM
jgi:hypothetical protein